MVEILSQVNLHSCVRKIATRMHQPELDVARYLATLVHQGLLLPMPHDERHLLIRVVEEPLTAQNLTTIMLALTTLSTKYWLIAKSRFADLIEYSQTHNERFAEEAHVVITKITLNSPMNMDWKIDLSAPSVAEALVTTIDGITQARTRLEKATLENQAKAQEIKHAEPATRAMEIRTLLPDLIQLQNVKGLELSLLAQE